MKILQRFARWCLKILVKKYDHEALIGDFDEIYESYVQDYGHFRANLWYWSQICRAFPAIIRNSVYWSLYMFKNYLKTTFRCISRQKTFSFINVFGMGIALGCCLLIVLFIRNELTYDSFHENSDSIYRIYRRSKSSSGKVSYYSFSPAPLADPILNEATGIENLTRIRGPRTYWIISGEKSIKAMVTPADSSFFDMFSFPLEINKNGQHVLDSISDAIISNQLAKKLFGDEQPVGKSLRIHEMGDFIITGILKDIPANSSLDFDVLVNINHIPKDNFTSWGVFGVETYVQLQRNYPPEGLESQISDIVKKHFPEGYLRQTSYSFYLQPLKDIYLNRQNIPGLAAAGSMSYIYILSGIALVIALIACINFMNLSIVNSSGRGKEIGMRKTLGAARSQIIKQFMTEAFFYSLLALIVGIMFARIFLPTFSHLLDKDLELSVIFQPISLLNIIGILLLFTLLSGGYPSFFLSRFNLNEIQKVGIRVGRNSIVLRKVLVILQFSLSLVFIIATFAMRSQLEFLRTRDLGFDEEHVVAVPYPEEKDSQWLDILKTELLKNPNLVSASGCYCYPGYRFFMELPVEIKDVDSGESEMIPSIFETVDESYISTLGIEISEGRNFSKEFSTDFNEAVIVNEKFVETAGLESPIGIELNTPFRKFPKGKIIGVVKNFHLKSLLYEIEPVVFIRNPILGFGHILVRIKSNQIQGSLAYIKNRWNKLVPEQPFEYQFLDSEFEKHYQLEKRWSKIALFSSILAIFIACLGMFGLVGLITVQRTKEIGIRKVLGASISNIITLLTKEFTILILASNVIAWPVAYLILRRWLQDYPYRITLGIGLFLIASFLAIIIALLTTTFQAARAAVADPVDTLKYE